MKEILDLSLGEFIARNLPQETFDNNLIVVELDGSFQPPEEFEFAPMRLEAHSVILAIKGDMVVDLDYQTYTLLENTVLNVLFEDIVENITFSPDFKGYHIIFSRTLLEEIMLPIISLLPKGDIPMRQVHPMQELDKAEVQIVLHMIDRIKRFITDKSHLYRAQLIKSELAALILELDNWMWKRYGNESDETDGHEDIRHLFRQLLIKHCRQEHEVSFYASKLNVTPDHLSKIMRDFSGRSAIKWINHALVTEAKILLRKPGMNIQQVSLELNFSDQSAFGKFFKKHAGISPLQYKNQRDKI